MAIVKQTLGITATAAIPSILTYSRSSSATKVNNIGRIELVAANEGWANVPPGARTSLYENPNYKDIPFAKMTLESILSADPLNSTVDPSPYVGIQFAAIPEFAGIATDVSQEFSAAYAGQQSIADALAKAQAITNDAMEAAGYR